MELKIMVRVFLGKIVAAISLVIAFTLSRTLSIDKISAVISYLKRYSLRDALYSEAESALQLITDEGYAFPVRIACFEKSLTSVLYLSFHRLAVKWCIGVGYDPFISHAWIEAENQPVSENEIDTSELSVIHQA
jgi:Transglutaminase-like superfamily